jgi:hypothetical protein
MAAVSALLVLALHVQFCAAEPFLEVRDAMP